MEKRWAGPVDSLDELVCSLYFFEVLVARMSDDDVCEILTNVTL